MLPRCHAYRFPTWLGLFMAALLCALLCMVASVGPVLAQDSAPGAPPDVKTNLYLPAVMGGQAVDNEVIPGQYIVVLKDPDVRAAAGLVEPEAAVAERMVAVYGGEVLYVYDVALSGFAIRTDADAALLAADANVAYVEPDRVVSVPQPTTTEVVDAPGELEGDLSAAALFTQTNAVWGLDRIDQHLLPLNTRYNYSTTASGVHAYIIDTGILVTHTQFTGRIGNGFTAIADGRGVVDCDGHGTHVAGTVGGATYGVAKGVTLHPVRVLNCSGSGSWAGVIAGVNWVTANRITPAVANMSLGGGISFAVRNAVERSIVRGVTYVVSAGNEDEYACSYSPASTPAAITVGATDNTDTRAWFSNWGNCVDIFAPGVAIKSAWKTSATATNIISGTSMASPHVAGVAALYLKDHPAHTPAQVASWLNSQATLDVVLDPEVGSPNRLLYSGLPGPGGIPMCTNRVANPGFESGIANWTRSSSKGLQLICNSTTCPGMAIPHAGNYLAWLGRNTDSETSQITNSPAFALPAGVPARLAFWYAIDSQDICGFDYGYVRVTAAGVTSTIKTFKLCYETNSPGWQRLQINLSAYAGKTVTISFRTVSDSSLPSSFYVDNVQVVNTASCPLPAADEGPVEEPENGSGEDIVPAPRP